MFVPLGLLLPMIMQWFRKCWRTYLLGFAFSGVIELTQLVTHRGMFEWDDLLGNTVGVMIGYGIFVILSSIRQIINKDKQSMKLLHIVALQLPLLITICSFGTIFGIYASKEIGINPNGYISAYSSNLIQVSTNVKLSDTAVNLPTYEIPKLTVAEAKEKGRQLFGQVGCTIDESRTDVYDNTIVLYSSNNNSYSMWINYKGGDYSITNFDVLYPDNDNGSVAEPVSGANETTIREALMLYGIDVPKGCNFESLENGQYRFTADMVKTDNGIMNGTIECTYYGELGFGEVNNQIVHAVLYKEYPAISEQKAYEKIANGEFYFPGEETLNIEVTSATLTYIVDSKAFYQPTYQFETVINGKENQILIPAYDF